MHILSLVTEKKTFLIQRKEKNDHRNYFMIKLNKRMGSGGIQLLTYGSAAGLATDCTMGSSYHIDEQQTLRQACT